MLVIQGVYDYSISLYKFLKFNTIFSHSIKSKQYRERQNLTALSIRSVFPPNPICFSLKELARKKVVKSKTDQVSRDSRPTLLPILKSRLKFRVGSWNFACS